MSQQSPVDSPAPPPGTPPATDWTPLPTTEPERTIALLKGDVAHAIAREQRLMRLGREARREADEQRLRASEAERAAKVWHDEATAERTRAVEALNERDAAREERDGLRRAWQAAEGELHKAMVAGPSAYWTRVTHDEASLPPAGETVLVWTAHGPSFAWWGQDVGGNPQQRWDHDNLHCPQDRDYVLAWQRVAGPGRLKQEG